MFWLSSQGWPGWPQGRKGYNIIRRETLAEGKEARVDKGCQAGSPARARTGCPYV